MFTVPGVGAGGAGGNMGSIWAEFGLDISKLRTGFGEARREINAMDQEISSSMERFGGMLTQFGTSMTMFLTAPLAGFALVTINAAAQFEQAMARVEAVSGATGRNLEDLQGIAREMGRETMFSATQAAQGLQFLAMAGWEVEDMMEGLPPIMRMAEAAQMDLARASDITSDIMTAFQIPAQEAVRVTDILARAATTANTNVEMLGETLAYSAPSADALGYELEEVVAAAGRLADAGIKGSRAGTTLDAVFRDLASMTQNARDELSEMNIEIFDSEGSMRSLADIIGDYETQLSGATDEQRQHVLSIGLTSRSLRGMNSLLRIGGDALYAYTNDLRQSEGAVDDMGDAIRDALHYELSRLRSIMESVLIDFGSVLLPMLRDSIIPIVIELAEWISDVSESVSQWDGRTQLLLVSLGLLLAAIGPISVGIGYWVKSNQLLFASLATVTTAVKAKTVAVTTLIAALGPVGIAYAGIATALGWFSWNLIQASSDTRDLNQEMDNFIEKSQELEDLADRYEELSGNTERTADEQRELNEVTREIADIMPSAVSGWDQYNNVLDINIGRVRAVAEEHQELAATLMELRIREQEELLQETAREYDKVHGVLEEFQHIHRVIREEMEDQRDAAIDLWQLEEIREGLYEDITFLIRQHASSWVEAQTRVAQFTNDLYHGNLTLADIDRKLLRIGEDWLMIEGSLGEQTEELERMRQVLRDIRGEVNIYEMSLSELKSHAEEVNAEFESAHRNMKIMAVVGELTRRAIQATADDSVQVAEVVDRMVARSEEGYGILAKYPAEYRVMLGLLQDIGGLKEFQLITEEEIRDLSDEQGDIAGNALMLYQRILALIEKRKEEEESTTEEIKEQEERLEHISEILEDFERRMAALGVRAAGYGRDLDVPIEKIGILVDTIGQLLNEGLDPTDDRIRDMSRSAIELSGDIDDTSEALSAMYDLLDTLAEGGAELSDPVLIQLIELLRELRTEMLIIAADPAEVPLMERIKQDLAAVEMLAQATALDINVQQEQLRIIERYMRQIVDMRDFEGQEAMLRTLNRLYVEYGGTIKDAGEIHQITSDEHLENIDRRIEALDDEETATAEHVDRTVGMVKEGSEAIQLEIDDVYNSMDLFREGILIQGMSLRRNWVELGQTMHRELSGALRDIVHDFENWSDIVLSFIDRVADHMVSRLADMAAYNLLKRAGIPGLPGLEEILSFRRGGKVPGLPNEPRLVMAHGQEWFVPPEVMDLMRQSLDADTMPVDKSIVVQEECKEGVEIDYDRLAKTISSVINNPNNDSSAVTISGREFLRAIETNPDNILKVIIQDYEGHGPTRQMFGRGS